MTVPNEFWQSKEKIPQRSSEKKQTAFRTEYNQKATNQEIYDDVVSYLAEYRLNVKQYDYELHFAKGQEGSFVVRDKYRGESMRDKAQRVIKERKESGLPTEREGAEEKGLFVLEEKLKKAQNNDTVLWASPPGPKEEGYGNYGFIYKGKVLKNADGEARLLMSAIRVENPTIADFNKAFSLLCEEEIQFQKAVEFLQNPKVFKGQIAEKVWTETLRENFAFAVNEEEKWQSAEIIRKMDKMIRDFIFVIRSSSEEKRIKALHALENYALFLKKQTPQKPSGIIYEHKMRLEQIIERFGFAPLPAPGSCGLSGSESSHLFTSGLRSTGTFLAAETQDKYGSLKFKCGNCQYWNTRPYGTLIDKCKLCGIDVRC